MADDGAHEAEAAGNESEARLPQGRVGASGPFIIDAGGKGDGVALWSPAASFCTLHRNGRAAGDPHPMSRRPVKPCPV